MQSVWRDQYCPDVYCFAEGVIYGQHLSDGLSATHLYALSDMILAIDESKTRGVFMTANRTKSRTIRTHAQSNGEISRFDLGSQLSLCSNYHVLLVRHCLIRAILVARIQW